MTRKRSTGTWQSQPHEGRPGYSAGSVRLSVQRGQVPRAMIHRWTVHFAETVQARVPDNNRDQTRVQTRPIQGPEYTNSDYKGERG